MQILSTPDLGLSLASGALNVVLGLLSLTGGWPHVDGVVYRNAPVQTQTSPTGEIVATYDLGAAGKMDLFISRTGPDRSIRYVLKRSRGQAAVNSFGLHFDSVAGMKRFYRSGYHSWDGSSFVQPDTLAVIPGPELALEKSFGVTELIPQDGRAAMLIGFNRHDRVQQTFVFGARKTPINLFINTLWDQKTVAENGELESEVLWILRAPDYEAGMTRWAKLVAEASPLPPRSKHTPLVGWGTWYNLYNFINEPLVLETLQSVTSTAKKESLPLNTFLIDAGFTPELGDWLKTTFTFPNGMVPITSAIKAAGYSPAFWIAPFLVGNRSQLYRDHPDWVLKEVATGEPKRWGTFYGEQRLGIMRSEEYFILDATVPEAFEYLRKVFRTWRQEWGVEAVKIDFSYLGAEYGPSEVRYRTPGMSRIEIWRRFAQMVREEMGSDALWIGSGQPLWASIGLTDTVRIAGDIGVVWSGNGPSAEPLVQNLPFRNFANHILWQIDPDAVLLRSRYHNLTDSEVRTLAWLAGMSGGVLMTSDDFSEMTRERLDLWKSLYSATPVSCTYPRFGKDETVYVPFQIPGLPPIPIAFSEPVIVQVRRLNAGSAIVNLANTSTETLSRNYTLSDLGFESGRYVAEFTMPLPSLDSQKTQSQITVNLAPRESKLFFLSHRSNPANAWNSGRWAGHHAAELIAGCGHIHGLRFRRQHPLIHRPAGLHQPMHSNPLHHLGQTLDVRIPRGKSRCQTFQRFLR